MYWTWESLVRIFTPSSRVVAPPGTTGTSMLQGITLGFSTSTSVMDQSIGLVFTHVP